MTEEMEILKEKPRSLFIRAVQEKNMTACLIKAAEFHGHYCPGGALGVMSSVYGLWELNAASRYFDGIMEELIAIVEVNACFADGIQAVTGCTLGNNALVYRDLGRMAVTFVLREENTGVRIRVAPGFREHVNQAAPDFYKLMQKVIVERAGGPDELDAFRKEAKTAAFSLIREPFEKLLILERVKPVLPGKAPIKPSVVCPGCGEEIMGTKIVRYGPYEGYCYICGRRPFFEVEGRGIVQNWKYSHPAE